MITLMALCAWLKAAATWRTCFQGAQTASWSCGTCHVKSPSSRSTHTRDLFVERPSPAITHWVLTLSSFPREMTPKSAYGHLTESNISIKSRLRKRKGRTLVQSLRTTHLKHPMLVRRAYWDVIPRMETTCLPLQEQLSRSGAMNGLRLSNSSKHGMLTLSRSASSILARPLCLPRFATIGAWSSTTCEVRAPYRKST